MLVNTENIKNSWYSVLLFLIWPFLALIFAFKNHDKRWSRNIIWLFTIFYGYTFVVVDTMDNIKYKEFFLNEINQEKNWTNFLDIFSPDIYGRLDVVRDIINFILTSFTDNYHVLFAVYGLIFGYFYSRNIMFLFENIQNRPSFWTTSIFIFFSLIIGIWELNGFRFWTATHIFIYFTFLYFKKANIKYIIGLFIPVLFHFAFIAPFLILLSYIFLGNWIKIYFIMFLVSSIFLFAPVDLSSKYLLGYTPEIYQEKVEGYNDEEYKLLVQEKRDSKSILVKGYAILLRSLSILVVIMIFIKRKYLRNLNKWSFNLFCFILFFLSIFSVVSSIPSVGRFLIVGYLLLFALFFITINNFNFKRETEFFIGLIFYFMITLLLYNKSGQILFSTSYKVILFNPIVSIFTEEDILSLADYIKKYFL